MPRTLSDEAMRLIVAFEDVTGAVATDCLVEEDRVVFVVEAGQMGTAIGPHGRTVNELEDRLNRSIKLVESATKPEAFVANALAPAAVYNVTISENDTRIAYAEVDRDDVGIAIGSGGRNIETARQLANRHFDLDDVQLV